MSDEKKCNICKKYKQLQYFYKDKSKSGGYKNSCSECYNKNRKKTKEPTIAEKLIDRIKNINSENDLDEAQNLLDKFRLDKMGEFYPPKNKFMIDENMIKNKRSTAENIMFVRSAISLYLAKKNIPNQEIFVAKNLRNKYSRELLVTLSENTLLSCSDINEFLDEILEVEQDQTDIINISVDPNSVNIIHICDELKKKLKNYSIDLDIKKICLYIKNDGWDIQLPFYIENTVSKMISQELVIQTY
jgi:hypothetical protein